MARNEEEGVLELTGQEVVESCYRAYCYALGLTTEFESLPGDLRERWGRAVRSAQNWLPTFDGKPARDAAQKMSEEYAVGDQILGLQQAPYQDAWEATVRHLNTIIDSDEVEDLGSLEKSWADWAQRRPKFVNPR